MPSVLSAKHSAVQTIVLLLTTNDRKYVETVDRVVVPLELNETSMACPQKSVKFLFKGLL